jgi:hypothetical protein
MPTLVDETGFPDPGFPNHRHHLAVSCPGTLQGVDQGRELRVASDKAGEPPNYCRLQAPPDATRPDQLEDVHRRVKPFDGDGSEGGDLD